MLVICIPESAGSLPAETDYMLERMLSRYEGAGNTYQHPPFVYLGKDGKVSKEGERHIVHYYPSERVQDELKHILETEGIPFLEVDVDFSLRDQPEED